MPDPRRLPGTLRDIDRDLRWSAAELNIAVEKRRGILARLGVSGGNIVVIAHGGTPEFFADLFAVWRQGAAAACLSPDLTPGQMRTVVEFCRPRAVLAGPGTADAELAVPIFDLAREARGNAPGPVTPVAPDAAALLLFTSGTTGNPKAVSLSFAALAARLEENLRRMPVADLARGFCPLPTHFGHGLIGNCLTVLAAGGELLLPGARIGRAAMEIGGLIDAHGITFMSSVPSFWKLALKMSRPPAQANLRRVHVGSAPLSAAAWTEIQAWSGTKRVVNMYGMTETANWAAGADGAVLAPRDGLIGDMWGGVAAIRHASGAIEAQGEGEIVVRTPSLMSGYFQRPDLTADAIVDGWYRTGDLGSIAGGVIRLGGRQKEEINRGGMKVQPAEIDLLLEGNEAVAEACCFALPDPILGETVAVAVRPVTPATFDLPALRAWCRQRLHAQAMPEKWYVVDAIPKTDRGKINRAMVMRHCLETDRK